MPVHTHDLYCWNGGRAGAGRQDDPPSGGAWLGNPQNSLPFVQVSVDTDDEAGVGVGSYPLSPNAVQNIGAGAGHENRQPFVAMSYIICVIGTQPTFSN
jgi:microcystin-dependent protein